MSKTVNFKLVLLGDTAVGKSSSVERFVKNEFFEFQQPTIGAAFLTQSVQLDDFIVKFEIWDTAGQERYRSLAPMYYRGAAAALVVYDITSYDSFRGAKTWIEELQRQGSSDIVIGLAGNKCDLEDKGMSQLMKLAPMLKRIAVSSMRCQLRQERMFRICFNISP